MTNRVAIVADAPLTTAEARDLKRLESLVDQGEQAIFAADLALHEISRRRLYRATHKTFDLYLADRWKDLSRSTAYEMIAVGEVIENVRTSDILVPQNRHQAKQLVNLTPETQLLAWKEAVKTAPKGKVTAAHVAATVERVTGKPPEAVAGEYSVDFAKAFAALKPEVKAEFLDRCRKETRSSLPAVASVADTDLDDDDDDDDADGQCEAHIRDCLAGVATALSDAMEWVAKLADVERLAESIDAASNALGEAEERLLGKAV